MLTVDVLTRTIFLSSLVNLASTLELTAVKCCVVAPNGITKKNSHHKMKKKKLKKKEQRNNGDGRKRAEQKKTIHVQHSK